MQWYNEPAEWKDENGTIHVVTEGKTDFWRTTHYGFIRDNGHFYAQEIAGNFQCTVGVRGQYRQQYDQAGLIVWDNSENWIKTGIEFVDGVQHMSAVVTRDYSDWSVVPLNGNPTELTLQVNRDGDAIEIRYSLDGVQWTMLRLAYLPPNLPVQVGMMCAAPDGDGFPVTFTNFSLKAAQ